MSDAKDPKLKLFELYLATAEKVIRGALCTNHGPWLRRGQAGSIGLAQPLSG